MPYIISWINVNGKICNGCPHWVRTTTNAFCKVFITELEKLEEDAPTRSIKCIESERNYYAYHAAIKEEKKRGKENYLNELVEGYEVVLPQPICTCGRLMCNVVENNEHRIVLVRPCTNADMCTPPKWENYIKCDESFKGFAELRGYLPDGSYIRRVE